MNALPRTIDDVAALEALLSRPGPLALEAMAALQGDLLLLGVGGKMGPTLARMARRAADETGYTGRIVGVSRFGEPGPRRALEQAGVETIAADLLAPGALEQLPDAENVIHLAGMKFGATGQEARTWAMNTYLPGLVAQRYREARIVALSTGNVYPFQAVCGGGADETVTPAPVGEYAQSCLGRERMFEHGALTNQTPVLIYRLNYAAELRYGVLLDVAQRVASGQAVDLAMGAFNVIWQGDANARVLACLAHAASPAAVLNITGPETVGVRWLAQRFGALLNREPVFAGEEGETALLNNAARSFALFGYPEVSLEQLIQWVAHWVRIDGPTLNKPTHFEACDGRF